MGPAVDDVPLPLVLGCGCGCDAGVVSAAILELLLLICGISVRRAVACTSGSPASNINDETVQHSV